ncbi:MAG: metallophosphoesterase, partial [Polyangiaceae bacterium]
SSRFVRILVGVTIAMHVPVMLAVVELARRLGSPYAWPIGFAWAAAGVALFFGRVRSMMPDRKRSPAAVRFIDVPYFVHWCAALWTLLLSVPLTLVVPLVDLARGAAVSVPMTAYLAAYASGLALGAYGVLVRRRWFRVVEREVRVPGLDPALDGLRVAHLSDLHVGMLTPKAWAQAWSRAANRLKPHVAVVTGDMVTSGVDFHEDIADALGELRAELGVFSSMGNHDYFGEGEPLVSLLEGRGIRVLRNGGLVVERGGGRLWLAAIDDTWTRRDDLELALRDRPAGMPTVLLAHDPARFDQAADAGVELVLSGHTHGGQVAVPFLAKTLSLSSLAHQYNMGFYTRGRSTLYVHPGLGTTGPPIRIGAAPEVTLLILRAA